MDSNCMRPSTRGANIYREIERHADLKMKKEKQASNVGII